MRPVQVVPRGELTRILKAWSEGDASALDGLTSGIYAELHRLARRHISGEREDHLLQPSALVNEAFVRLAAGVPVKWSNRAQFFAFAARIMRQILIDSARAQGAAKRGRRIPHLDLSRIRDPWRHETDPVAIIDLNTALDELAALDPRQAQIVELRYFGGLENREIAEVMGISESTVIRDWHIARAWLFDRLRSPTPPN